MKKPLPQIKTIEYTLNLALSNKKLRYRAYNTADERVLLAATQARGDDVELYVNNTLNVIDGVILNEDIDLESIPSVETKLLMLALRGKSVGEQIEFKIKDKNDKSVDMSINTDQFYIKIPTDVDYNKIQISDDLWIEMRPLSFRDEASYITKFRNAPTEVVFETIFDSIYSIYNTEDVWIVGQDITKSDVEEFIGQLSGVSNKLYEWYRERPCLAVRATIDGEEREITEHEADFLS